ncbi:tetratricopeptide repeat protein [bacterium]|nr:tetratricopeptide repeat protein [bacterium]
MKRALLALALAGMGWAQPILPGQALPEMPNQVPQTADMREAKFLFAEGQRYHREDKIGRAVDLYRKALAKDPGRLEYRPYLAQALESQGHHADALEQYDLYLALEPDDPKVQRSRLLPLIGLARWEEVDREMKVLDLSQSAQPDYLLLKGLNWLRRNQPDLAVAPLRSALQLAPKRQDIRLNLVSALLLQNLAQEAFDLLVDQSGDQAALLRGLALHLLRRGDEAEKVWRGLLTNPQLVEVGLNLATSLAERGQSAEALRLAAQMLDRDPANQGGKLLYARLLNRAGRYEDSLAVLRPLLDPDGFVGNRAYLDELAGWTLLGLNRDEEALTYLRQALKLGAQGASLENNLALVLGRLGQVEEAIQHQLQAVQLAPLQASAWYHLGVLYELKASPKQARPAYQQFLKLAPNDPAVAGLKAHLKDLNP